jgi:hypothetical protein
MNEDLGLALSSDKIKEIVDEIVTRCDTAKITYENQTDFDVEDDVNIDITVQFTCGRETKPVYLTNSDDLQIFRSIEFEKYILLGSYAAICSYKDGTIEAVLSSPSAQRSGLQARRILRDLGVGERLSRAIKEVSLVPSVEGFDGVEIKLMGVSKAAQILTQASNSLPISLVLKCPKLKTHDEALKILNMVSNALFFEIDLQKGIHLSLLRRTRKQSYLYGSASGLPIAYPKNIYDENPLALYWYARTATNMPLLQFLAYYQVLEYYYAFFYNAEISGKVRSIIKNPNFRADRETDISKIVSTIRSRGTGVVSEKDQLKVVVRACIQNEDIEDFLANSSDKTEFFFFKS